MKIRDSGMPDEGYWESLFDVPLILRKFEIERFSDVAELGCGYGTFSVPIAKSIRGTVHTFDIDPAMVKKTLQRSKGLPVLANVRDVMEQGFGVTAEAVLLFNILHCEQPTKLLAHARSALKQDGEILIIHWRHDRVTPRGPAVEIRPRPEQIAAWGAEVGLKTEKAFDLPPWHFGIVLKINHDSDCAEPSIKEIVPAMG